MFPGTGGQSPYDHTVQEVQIRKDLASLFEFSLSCLLAAVHQYRSSFLSAVEEKFVLKSLPGAIPKGEENIAHHCLVDELVDSCPTCPNAGACALFRVSNTR